MHGHVRAMWCVSRRTSFSMPNFWSAAVAHSIASYAIGRRETEDRSAENARGARVLRVRARLVRLRCALCVGERCAARSKQFGPGKRAAAQQRSSPLPGDGVALTSWYVTTRSPQ